MVKRVKQLLGGHPDLLDGFNCFLPEVRAPHTTHPSPSGKPRRLSRPRAVVVARAGESSRAPGSARRELPRGPTGRPPRRVNPASGRVTRARSSRSRPRGARQRRSPPNPFSHFSLTSTSLPSPHPQPYKFSAVKDAAAEAANVSDPARESPLIERIHPSSRSPDVFRGAFAPRTTARRVRGRARGHQKPGLKPTDHLARSPSARLPNPSARDPRRARDFPRGYVRGTAR